MEQKKAVKKVKVEKGSSQKLPAKTKIFYGIGDLGNAIINSAIQFYLLKFYTDVALILPALAGNALLVGKIWDAVNDPIFGWLTDRTNSKVGRRRVFMLFGAIPLGIAIALLWFIPKGLSLNMTFLWIAFTFILFDTLWTLTNVPYYALTSELTDDYDERSSLTTTRMVMAVPAYLVGVALTPVIAGLFALERTGWGYVGIIYGSICAIVLLISAAGLKERQKVLKAKAKTNVWQSIKAALSNKPFQRLCIAYFVINLSFALVKTLMAYYLEYQLLMESEISLVMGLMLICVTISLPFWKKLSEKLDKGPAYALGMVIGALAVGISFFLTPEQRIWIYPVAVLAGIGFGSQWIFPWAMVADVVDYDRVETGEFRSGMYYGIWGLATKISEALAISGIGWMLTGFGYVANVAQTEHSLFGIRLFFGPIPAIVILVMLPMLIWYPITRKKHAEIRAKLEKMEPVEEE
ncbi:MAG: MFS transporter [Chloroflexi bacterium]|nr:MFS transporter [Chloroflexota bacterium]